MSSQTKHTHSHQIIIIIIIIIVFCCAIHCTNLIGIVLPGTELLDSQVRTKFSIGLFHAVFIWLTTEFSSARRVLKSVMSQPL